MHRESDLIDVWFDSGSMPYAQLHYPFEGAINFNDDSAEIVKSENHISTEEEYRELLVNSSYKGTPLPPAFFPADFINEGVDQTRGWFLHCMQSQPWYSTPLLSKMLYLQALSSMQKATRCLSM